MKAPRHADLLGEIDAAALEQGYTLVAGVDEVGVGAMAGPVVAAAVILPNDRRPKLAADSKTLTPERRNEAFEEIRGLAVAWAIGVVDPEIVDRLNIYHATHLAMRQALLGLRPSAEFALVDGRTVQGLPVPHRAVPGGDALSPSIGAASIVAKVLRDRIMDRLDLLHPGYGLSGHKGYCTPDHRAAVVALGPSPIHRRSFEPVGGRGALRLPLSEEA